MYKVVTPIRINQQAGKVYIKVFWLTSIILSLFLTLLLNLIFNH